ncbi:MAG TPA: beta-propeller fold lactonase family protein [Planctomycetota bacterium]|nr:beta-propeller fold lactonase family protein [Planctomycetota bacterium]
MRMRPTTILGAMTVLGLTWGCQGATGTSSSKSTAAAPVTSNVAPTTSGTAPVMSGVSPTTSKTTPAGAVSRFLYVGNNGTQNVTQYSINATTGAVSNPMSFSAGGAVNVVATDPANKFLFAMVQLVNATTGTTTNTVETFAINPTTGALTLNATSTPTLGSQPYDMKVDSTGSVVVVCDFVDDTVTSLKIDPTTGALTANTPVSLGTAGTVGANGVAISPDSKFVYVTGYLAGSVTQLTLETGTGNMAIVGTPVTATNLANACPIALDPTGALCVVATQDFAGFAGTLVAFTRNATTGALTAVGSPTTLTGNPLIVAIDKNGHCFASCDSGTGAGLVLSFSVGNSGALTATSPASAATGTMPAGFCLDNSGTFAFAADFSTDDIQPMSVSATGALTDGTLFTSPTPSLMQSSAVCVK